MNQKIPVYAASAAAVAIAASALALGAAGGGPQQAAAERDVYLFSEVDQAIDEDRFGIPPDQFSDDQIVVNRGDTVRVHFYNLEPVETQERHTFTIDDGPYSVETDINAGESGTVAFVASEPGIFDYTCTYHEPTMSGRLVVLG